MEFTFDSTALAGKSVVVFESLEYGGTEVASHADIEDGGQTVTFLPRDPEISTCAMGMEGEKELDSFAVVTLIDTVSYENLTIHESYTLKGILMDKGSNSPLQIDGMEVTAETMFKPDSPTGTVEVVFVFDSSSLAGKTLVVFESLEDNGIEIAFHTDIEDEGQTVTVKADEPTIKTSAAGANGEKELDGHTTITLVDTVSYDGLTIGNTYTLKGILMDKGTNSPLLIGGMVVTAETIFEPDSPTGMVEVVFVFDSTSLAGKTLVVFESLKHDGIEIASHTDIEDEGQIVTVKANEPAIRTSAAGANGEKELDSRTTIKLVDTVSYDGLAIGKTYTLKGKLMDKGTSKPLLIGGMVITAKTIFEPDSPTGTVEVVFVFDSTSLAGRTLVVFESLEDNGTEIASHADMEDVGQTVTFKRLKIGTSAKAKDGGKTVPLAESVTVVDTVTYENLIPHRKYTLRGTLRDKATGLPLMKDGKEVTSVTEFVPPLPSGSTEVRFTFDSRAIGGRTLVVFETLEWEGTEVASLGG